MPTRPTWASNASCRWPGPSWPAPCSARGDHGPAAAAARAAVDASRGLTFTFPLAVCLETAALVILAAPDGDAGAAARLLAAAGAIRARGDRPGPPALRAEADRARAELGVTAADEAHAAGPADASTLALEVLGVLGHAREGRPEEVDACTP